MHDLQVHQLDPKVNAADLSISIKFMSTVSVGVHTEVDHLPSESILG